MAEIGGKMEKYTLLKRLSIIMIVGRLSFALDRCCSFTFGLFGGIGEIQLLLFMIVAVAVP